MTEWLQDVFWLFQLVMAQFMILPVIVGGILMTIVQNNIRNIWRRIISILGILILEGLIITLSFSMISGSMSDILQNPIQAFREIFLWLFLPIRFEYPYINIVALLFLWFPNIAQLYYVFTRSKPKIWMTALVGFLSWIAGIAVLVMAGIAVGAQTD